MKGCNVLFNDMLIIITMILIVILVIYLISQLTHNFKEGYNSDENINKKIESDVDINKKIESDVDINKKIESDVDINKKIESDVDITNEENNSIDIKKNYTEKDNQTSILTCNGSCDKRCNNLNMEPNKPKIGTTYNQKSCVLL
jgi:cell division protein FtsX